MRGHNNRRRRRPRRRRILNAAPMSKPSTATNQQIAKASKSRRRRRRPALQVPPTNLPDMSITATRISQPLSQLGMTVTVVDKQQIQDQKIQQTSDALREVPGVQVTQSGGPGTDTDVSIRGSSTSQVLTLLDGVEVNTGGLGTSISPISPPTMRAESKLYGARADRFMVHPRSAASSIKSVRKARAHRSSAFSLTAVIGTPNVRSRLPTALSIASDIPAPSLTTRPADSNR